MKKVILTLSAIHFSLFTLYAQSGGNGTAGNPYQIKNCNDLQAMELHKASYWKMMNDVDCSATKTGTGQWGSSGFRPIGDSVGRFTGNFNGNCYSVANLFINNPTKNFVGLFGYTDSNAYIKSVEIINSEVIGKDHTGMLIGYKLSTTTDDAFTAGKVKGGNYTGGVVGGSDNYQGTQAELTNAASEATVNGKNFTGGVVGKLTTYQGGASYITNCYSTGNVTGNNSTGGIAGHCGTYEGGGAQLQYCYSTGIVTGNDSTGGLVGNIGPIMGGGSYIVQSYFTGSVSGRNDVGGLAGYNGPNSGGASNIYDDYNQGQVSGSTNVGGIVGYQVSTGRLWGLDTCYNTGHVSGTTNVGGMIGNQSNASWDTLNYWDSVITPTLHSVGNLVSVVGINKEGTLQMQNQATYLNWNFVNEWNITAGNFPTLYPSPTNGACNFPATLTAAFDMTPDSTCSGDTVYFYDRSTNSPTGWSWNFGDPASGPNNTSALQNPTHLFSSIGWYTVNEVITKGANKDSVSSPIHIYCGVTGVNQLAQMQSVKIYPNPSNGKFTIQNSGVRIKNSEVGVYNVLGEKVYSSTLNTQTSVLNIDLSGQPNGVYMYRIVDETGNLIGDGKLMIQ